MGEHFSEATEELYKNTLVEAKSTMRSEGKAAWAEKVKV